ncbi:acid sensing ion channel subunit 1 [Homo sapiens]|uniref:Isoform 1 of Acid-sensing ion channel 1 n=1 Tax=Homo sapiens TaxID=9606 RepID=P78348-1|nr:acid-sensing ion channel 1 isoform a [Homo sapiens]EAW58116.1 amiloride-sensitive cation channel 2, neuronal, isoform CRA_a [Homo sapiens]KAI2565621.1 acid sensing ion channel subunit 1 [Homo sapiens]KAI4065875.1 acid sensing ion channel subunit 1 [Homo sapiens]|eukprot:NP_064423.2 acid-sensing ion channel 1 isoform a [Homo sapiens]
MELKAEEEEVGGVQPVSIQAFASSSTLHGLAHIFSYERLSLKRALWALCFLGSLAVLLCVCTERVQYYFHYHHVTKLDEVAASQLTFPAVTLCNLNEFRFSQVSKNDLYHAGELLALLNNRYEIPDTQMADEKQLEILQDKANFRSFKPKPFNMREFYDRAGHDIRDMLLSCHFRGEVCSAEDFKVVFTRYGKCYTFNSGRDGRPRLKTMKGGTGNGLEIMLDIQQDEYLPVWGETDETSFEAGIKVQIHSQDEPPFIDQLGFGVAPGFQTFVACQEQRLIYLPPPWGTCKAVTMDSDLDFFDSYSITACRIDCETRYLVENCNCRMVHMPGDAPYCTPEQYKECADPALDFLVEKDQEYCVCEMPCNLTRYGKELSMVKIPSKASAKYLAKKFNKSEQYIGENILVLDIFFEVLNYETIEQKKAYEIAGLLGELLMTPVPFSCHGHGVAPYHPKAGCSLLSHEGPPPQRPFPKPCCLGDIGGQMGLFIGASILTVLELFDYAYEVIKHKLCRRGKCQKEAKRSSADKGVALSLDDVKRHNPCESLRGHPAGMTYAANILPHHPARGTFEDFTC